MAQSYRTIHKEPHFAKIIWDIERTYPQWWKDADAVWCPTFESFMDFWNGAYEIFGLFDGEDLAAAVYLELESDTAINIHISIIKKLPDAAIVRFFRSLSLHKASVGIVTQTGYLLDKNRQLLAICADAGYHQTGLAMKYGSSRGRVLRWLQVSNRR